MMKKLGIVITCLVMILLLVSCANKRKDLVLSNFPSVQNELTEKDLLKAVGAPHEKSSSLSDVTQLYEKLLKHTKISSEEISDGRKYSLLFRYVKVVVSC